LHIPVNRILHLASMPSLTLVHAIADTVHAISGAHAISENSDGMDDSSMPSLTAMARLMKV
jgi:hypothetical protein